MTRRFVTALALILSAGAHFARALPTMIRLGYNDCAACHISPQGGGLLNAYGRGIDEAQSLRAAEYRPANGALAQKLSWGGRITQDVRGVTQQQLGTATGQAVTGFLRSRWMYRNATEFGKGFRFSGVVVAENRAAHRPNLMYDRSIRSGNVYVPTALLSFRANPKWEIAVGRDQLPTGVNVPDLNLFVRSRHRLGFYDAPTQIKVFWMGRRHQVVPYGFAPGGNERPGEQESGGGLMAEYDLLGKQRTVVGINALRGGARNWDRTTVGPYVRLGFGQWGILAEHDFTSRRLASTGRAFGQSATYGQVFWAAREWLVASAIGERLSVAAPFREHLIAGRFELVSRLSSQFTVGISTRIQRNRINGALAPSVALQLAMKSVN